LEHRLQHRTIEWNQSLPLIFCFSYYDMVPLKINIFVFQGGYFADKQTGTVQQPEQCGKNKQLAIHIITRHYQRITIFRYILLLIKKTAEQTHRTSMIFSLLHYFNERRDKGMECLENEQILYDISDMADSYLTSVRHKKTKKNL
jgi:hypothetical protein